MRTFKIKLPSQLQPLVINTNAYTLGDFKTLPEISSLNIDWGRSILVDRATKNSFINDDAVLPAIDAILFLVETKFEVGGERADLYNKIKKYKEEGKISNTFNHTIASNAYLRGMISDIEIEFGNTEETATTSSISTIDDIVECIRISQLEEEFNTISFDVNSCK